MNCDELKLKLADFLSDNLEPEQRSEVQTHLQECSACQEELALYEKTWGLLGQAGDLEPEPGYVARFWEKMAAEKPWYARWWGGRLNKKLVPIALAACIIGVVMATFHYQTTQVSMESTLKYLPEADIEFVENIELAQDLELIQDMDLLEDLGDWGLI